MLQTKQILSNSKFIQASGTTLAISGTNSFSKINGLPDLNILSNNITLQTNNATGQTNNIILDANFVQGSGFDGLINRVKIQSDGKLLLIGDFTRTSDSKNVGITRLNINGTTDTSFISSVVGGQLQIIAIQPSDGKILVGGNFTTYSGVSANKIVRLNTNGTIDNTFVTGSGFDLAVNAIAVQPSDGKILIGGNFTTYSGVTRNRIIRLNTNGSVDGTFSIGTGFDSDVFDVAVQSNGKILIGGYFSIYSGFTSQGIIRLNTNGSIDTSFQTGGGFDLGIDYVMKIAVQPSDGKIILGGVFTKYSGSTYSTNIIRLNTNGSIDFTFATGGGTDISFLGYGVDAITIQPDNKIIIAGEFSTYSGISASNITRLNTNGRVDNTFNVGSGFSDVVFDIAYRTSDNKIVAVGQYTQFNALKRSYITQLTTLGAADTIFSIINVGFNNVGGTVSAIAYQTNNKPVITGTFSSYSGISYNRIIRLNTDQTIDTTFHIGGGLNNTPATNGLVIQSDGKILIGGNFTTYSGVTRNRIIRLNTDGTIDSTFSVGVGFNIVVNAIAVQPSDGKILVGGNFTTYSGVTRNRIIRLNTNGSVDGTFSIGTGFNAVVNAIAVQPSDGKILVGGNFTQYSGATKSRIIRLNTNGTIDSTFSIGAGFNGSVVSIVVQPSDGKILVGGGFGAYSGATRNRIIRLNTNGTIDNTFNIGVGFNSTPSTIVIQANGKILVGGSFTTYSGVTKNRIIALDSAGAIDNTLAIGFDNTVNAIAIQGINILIGGTFTFTDSTLLRLSLARLLTGLIYKILVNTTNGIEYTADFSPNYSSRSLVDNAFVSSLITPTVISGINGLTTSSRRIRLGGIITGSTVFTDNRVTKVGFEYGGNYSTGFTNLSLVHKGFVTGLTSVLNTVIISGATNGLTKSSKLVSLGGVINASTVFTDNRITKRGLEYAGNYTTGFTIFSIPHVGFVTAATASILTGVTNGLTLTGKKIKLGGLLTGDTKIYGQSELSVGFKNVSLANTNNSRFDMNTQASNVDVARGSHNGLLGAAYSMVQQSDGKLIFGGPITEYNSRYNFGITRITLNGESDNSFNIAQRPVLNADGGFDNIIYALLLQADSKIIVSGPFTQYSGTTLGQIARFTPDGYLDTTFNVGGIGFNGGNVNKLISQPDGKMIAVGGFSLYNGVSVGKIVRLNVNGSIDTSFSGSTTGFNAELFSVALQSDGKILVGGQFTQFNGVSHGNCIIRLNTDGSYDSSFVVGSGIGGSLNVLTIAIQSDGKILAGGGFTQYSGVTKNKIIRLNTNGSIDNTFVIGAGFNDFVQTILIQSSGKILVGGAFTTYSGATALYFIRINTNGSIDTTYPVYSGLGGSIVYTIFQQTDGKVILSGGISFFGSYNVQNIIRFNIDGTVDKTVFNINNTEFDNVPVEIAYQPDGKLLVAGVFTTFNGVSRNQFTRLNADTTLDTTFSVGVGFNNRPEVIIIQPDGKIVLAGYFQFYSGVTKNRIIRLNTNGFIDNTFQIGTGFNGAVLSGAQQSDGKMIFAGNFTQYSGVTRNCIIRLNSNGTIDNTFTVGIGFTGFSTVNIIRILSDGKIMVGGGFTTYNGSSANNLVRLNSNGTIDTSFSTGGMGGSNSSVTAMDVQSDGKVLIGGFITAYSGVSRGNIARVNTNGTLDINFGAGFDSSVETITYQTTTGKIFVGGTFIRHLYNNTVTARCNGVIRLDSNGFVDTSYDFGTGVNGDMYAMLYDPATDYLTLIGAFKSYNGQGANGLIRVKPATKIKITNPNALQYDIDYSSNYTKRSVVDAGYVTGLTTNVKLDAISLINSSSTLASSVDLALVATTAGTFTINLPLVPTNGYKVTVKDDSGNASANNVTVSGNTRTIDGLNTFVINSNYGSATYTYSSSRNKWYVKAFTN